jgi:N-terminal domain of anti-restriction factor ArdC
LAEPENGGVSIDRVRAEEFGYSSGIWGSYRQWTGAGAQVRQGEKAAFVVFYKELAFAADPETGDAKTATRLFARATPVFAAEQVDGYQAPELPITVTTPIEQAEVQIFANNVTTPRPAHALPPGLRRPSTSKHGSPPTWPRSISMPMASRSRAGLIAVEEPENNFAPFFLSRSANSLLEQGIY